ncbi:hypothetical protein WBP_0287 [Wolbachia endosymbiont of Brugia pahangi]|nr:hypothetical protein WBP_0287 [Wolbachia endosymbiont of Brugia pahangi]
MNIDKNLTSIHTASMQEKRIGGRNFLQNLVFTTLAFAVVTGLCVAIASSKEMNRVYKTISCKLDTKKAN